MADLLDPQIRGQNNYPELLKDMSDNSWAKVVAIVDAWKAPVATAWTSATAQNTANTVTTLGYDGVMISVVVTGTVTAGVLTFEVYDGAAWIPVQAGRMDAYGSIAALTLATGQNIGYQVNTAGATQFRARLSTVITGSGSVAVTVLASSAPMPDPITVGIDPSQPLPAGTNALGSLTASSAVVGDVGLIYRTSATNAALASSILSPATPAVGTIKVSAGRLVGWTLTNNAAALRSVKFFNATAPTLGTTAAVYEIDIPAGGMTSIWSDIGVGFSTAMTWSVTIAKGLTDNTSTGLAANDVSGVIFYA